MQGREPVFFPSVRGGACPDERFGDGETRPGRGPVQGSDAIPVRAVSGSAAGEELERRVFLSGAQGGGEQGLAVFPVRWRMSAPARRSAGIMRERPRRTARARGVSENPRMLRKSGFVPQPVILASVSLSSAKSSAVTAPMRAARHRFSESAMPGRGRLSAARAGEGRLSVPA